MLRLALELGIPMIAYVLAATVALVLFIWTGVDIWVALVVVFCGLLVFAWFVDRKDKPRARER